jgi:hypothetical protein
MPELKLLSTALVAAALLAAPAMARESQVTSRRLASDANACTTTGAHYLDGHACYSNGPSGLHGDEDRDLWGHWGAYYGPMIHVP